MNEQLKAIANSYAEEYHSDAIYPAHLGSPAKPRVWD